MKELFKNNLNAYSPWWNKTGKTMLVALLDENSTLIKKIKILPHEYIIVPPNTTLKLISLS